MTNQVLIVDDDKFIQKVLTKFLRDDYSISIVNNGEEALAHVKTNKPSIILLDVEMPGQNGYEVCDALKQNPDTKDIPVIFLSSKSSMRERMLGFEVGGDDYLVKPCSQELLLAKLSKLSEYIEQRNKLKTDIQHATNTTLEAMSSSAELGKIVRLIKRSYQISSIDKLASELNQILRELDLHAGVMFVYQGNNHFYSTHEEIVVPLEQELIAMMHEGNRIIDFGCRTQINFPRVALLMKNMPLEDRNRYGRIKDSMPFLLEAIDAKLKILSAEHAFKKQNEALEKVVYAVQITIKNVSHLFNFNQKDATAVMSQLNLDLSLQLNNLGLEEDQENFILDRVEQSSEELRAIMKKGGHIEESLEKVAILLDKINKDQNRIINESLSSKTEDIEDNSDDIELF
ncbi:MAG: response regulator [Saccharospirillaceae bacterium]|nr:response regulator [Pseudomonadales bacterium]NRB78083.1 response regulator [Saccharospirillaceae bacterium]